MLLPQGWKVSISAGCLPVSSANSLNSVVVPRSLTPRKTSGFGGTSESAAAGAGTARAHSAARPASVRLRVLEDILHPSRFDPECLRIGGAALADHPHLHQLRLLPGREDSLSDQRPQRDQAR